MPVYEHPLNLTLLGNEPIAVLPSRILGIGETAEPGAGQGSATEIILEKSEVPITVREDYTTVLNLLRFPEEFMQLTSFHGGRKIAMATRWINYIQSVEDPKGGENIAEVYAGDQGFMTADTYSYVLSMYKVVDPFKTFQVSAYANMYENNVDFASLGLDWTPITGYSSESVEKRHIETDLAAGTLKFPYDGVHEISVGINLEHNESNQGRQTNLRFYNVTAGAPSGDPIPISIGRNQPGLNFTDLFKTTVTEAMVNQAFRIELGGGDSIIVSGGSIDYGAKMIGPWDY